ncbi:sugar phosphate nucleotidyltransferase, partial [Campylobacter avium]
IRERKKLGTAGALSLIEDVPNKSFIVMNADILTDLDFTELLNAHKKSKASMTVCLRQFSHQIPYGVIYSKKSILTDIKEKPMQSFDIAAGIYVLENKILQYIKKDEYLDMPDLIKIALANKEKICTYTINDYWIDIGRLSEYKKANEELIL